MVRVKVAPYLKRYMRKKVYHYKRYLLPLPKAIGDLLDTKIEYMMVQVEGQMQNNTAADGAVAKLYYESESAPANGAAITGTQAGKPSQTDNFPTASKRFPFGICTVISGLTKGTAYWFDLSLAAITGGTASLNNLEVVITEL